MKFRVVNVRNVQGGENTSLEVEYKVFDGDVLLGIYTFKISAAFLRLETVENVIRQTMINHYYAVNNLPAIIAAIESLEFEIGVDGNHSLGKKAYGESS